MKRFLSLIAVWGSMTVFALEVPEARRLGDPDFVKGFDAYSATVRPGTGGPLLTRDEAKKFAEDLLTVAGKTAMALESRRDLEIASAVFANNPYSLTAAVTFDRTFSSFFTSQQLALVGSAVPAAAADEAFRKASYLYGMRLRLSEHVGALARAADWDQARRHFPGGKKKFGKTTAGRK